jgi:hypothetical protein
MEVEHITNIMITNTVLLFLYILALNINIFETHISIIILFTYKYILSKINVLYSNNSRFMKFNFNVLDFDAMPNIIYILIH